METGTVLSKAPRPTVDEDALASQVLEIIGGISLEALQTMEEPEVWPMEEGDDSVFYSDEDQAHQDMKAPRGFGANKCKHPVNSVAADEDDPGEECTIDKDVAELEKDVTQQVILTEQEVEQQELQTPKPEPMDQSDPADPAGAQTNITPEKSVSTCGESLNCTIADMQKQQNTSAEKANLPAEKEVVTPNLEPCDETDEQSYTTLNREADVSELNSSAELQVSGLHVEPEQDHNSHIPVGFHQNPGTGYSTLPLPKKSCGGAADHQKSFNHLSASRYSTVSYRKIRRGNTRQKIEEFEYMIMNL